MSEAAARALAKLTFALCLVLLLGSCAAIAAMVLRGAGTWGAVAESGFILVFFIFPVVGMIIARRLPKNAVAWVLLGVGVAWQSGLALDVYNVWGREFPGSVPGPEYAAAFAAAAWVPGVGLLGTFLLLLFPDGHLPTMRWRWWARLCAVVLVAAYMAVTFSPGVIEGSNPPVQNPLGIPALGDSLEFLQITVLLLPVCMLGCVVALIRRYRRSGGIERLQLKWFTATCAFVAAVYVVAMLLSVPYDWSTETTPTWVAILQDVSLATFTLIPIAVGIAITRHHLYDIDRIINRTLVYSAASALLALVYVVGVVGSQALLRAVTGTAQNNIAVAASTLAVAALFRPVRNAVQRFVDRRFYRSKYDAARTVEAFSAGLRHETDLQALTEQLRDVVAQTVQPAGMALWIEGRHGEGLGPTVARP